MKIFTSLFLLSLLLTLTLEKVYTQPDIIWDRTFGGTGSDESRSFIETDDNGFLILAFTDSDDGDIAGYNGNGDIFLIKLNAAGELMWKKTIGSFDHEGAVSILPAIDQGYILGANFYTIPVSTYNDALIIKTDEFGNVLWQKTYGGSNEDKIFSMCASYAEDGYLFAGQSESADGDIPSNNGDKDLWFFKVDLNGELEWSKTIGGSSFEHAYSVAPVNGGGYVLAGATASSDGDVSDLYGSFDFWVIRIDEQGNLIWEKTYGGSLSDGAWHVLPADDGGFLVSGGARSEDGDITSNFNTQDVWVIKIDSLGNLEWQKSFGGFYSENATSAAFTLDGGILVLAYSGSNDGDASGNHSLNTDIWLVKLDQEQNIEWQKMIGGTGSESSNQLFISAENEVFLSGTSKSSDGDISENKGWNDLLFMKLSKLPTGVHDEIEGNNIQVYPNPNPGRFMVYSEKHTELNNLIVFNDIGQIIYRKNKMILPADIVLGDLMDGIYTLQAEAKDGQLVLKRFVLKN